MKIAVPSKGKTIDSQVDMRFGRCPYYIIVETEDKKIKNHKAKGNEATRRMRGAGITAAQFIANQNIDVILTGNIGPKAYDVLSPLGIEIVTGASGKVKEVVDKYLKGELKGSGKPKPGFGRGKR